MIRKVGIYWSVVFLAVLVATFRIGLSSQYGAAALRSYIYDDGFYYLEIAENIVQGHGSTFDEVSSTNGYQPLWMLILLPIASLTSHLPTDASTLLFLLWNLAFYSMIALVACNMIRKRWGQAAAMIAVLMLAFSKFASILSGGVEAPLLAIGLLTVYITYEVISEETSGSTPFLAFGMSSAIVVLTRLDHVFFVLPFFCVLTWRMLHGHLRIRQFVLTTLPGVVLVGAYFSLNQYLFGHVFPISGANKVSAFLSLEKTLW
ncbi:glycosyltransferase family 39 protein, partial [bacterium]|nr:glycosyltransferase family 39 protein [bacterium]